jgi:hypothetical protein
MQENRRMPISAAVSVKTRPLAARRSDDRTPTGSVGTPDLGAHTFSTGFESPPDPLKDQVPTERRSPPRSHTDAATTK